MPSALASREIADIATRYDVSAPQLCIRYLLGEGPVVLPKATSTDDIRQNAELQFETTDTDMEVLDAMRDTDQHPYAMASGGHDARDRVINGPPRRR